MMGNQLSSGDRDKFDLSSDHIDYQYIFTVKLGINVFKSMINKV